MCPVSVCFKGECEALASVTKYANQNKESRRSFSIVLTISLSLFKWCFLLDKTGFSRQRSLSIIVAHNEDLLQPILLNAQHASVLPGAQQSLLSETSKLLME